MTDKELYTLCRQYGKEARKWKRKFVALLPEVYKRRLYKKKGFSSIFEFAAKIGGVSKNVVREVIRVEARLDEMPKLKEKIEEIGVHKVRIVASIARKEDEEEWARKATEMTKAALETHVRDIRKSHPGMRLPTTKQESFFDNDYENFTVKLDPKIIEKLRILKANMKEGTCWNDVFKKLLDGGVTKVKKSRARNLKAEKRDICEVPGCGNPSTVVHHRERYSLTKKHEKLASLCKAHHELAHRGYLDEENDFKTKISPIIDPIKMFVDRKMLVYLKGT